MTVRTMHARRDVATYQFRQECLQWMARRQCLYPRRGPCLLRNLRHRTAVTDLHTPRILIFGQDHGRRGTHQRIHRYCIGPTGSHAVKEMLDAAGTGEPKGWAGLISIGVVLFAAIGFVGSLQDALDKIWDAPPRPVGLWSFVKSKLFSLFSLVLGAAFMLLSSCSSYPPRCQHSRQASRLHSDCQTRSSGLSLSSPTFLYPASSSLRYSSSCRPCSFLGARLP